MSWIDEYQHFCKTTAIYPDANTQNDRELQYLALGLASEAGEVAGKVKKLYRDGIDIREPDNREIRLNLIKELGDCLWYLAMLSNNLDTSLTRLAIGNRDNLIDRQNRDVISGSGDNR